MTEREQAIARAILEGLNDSRKTQLAEAVLHAVTNLKLKKIAAAPTGLNEFTATLEELNVRGWVIGTPSEFEGGRKWRITDLGESIRLENQ